MNFDIYGGKLQENHCEVHPYVHEQYPCSACYAEKREKTGNKQIEEKARVIENMRDEIFNMRQHINALEDGIRLILPLAKGYAAIHCEVQSSRDYIDKAESLLPQNEGNL